MPKSADPELVKYIQKHLKKGFKLKNIKKRLSAVGHSAETIEMAALEAVGESAEKSSRLGIIILIVVIAASGAGLVWFLGRTATEYTEHLEVVEEFEKNVSYSGMTDVQLIMLAKDGDMDACKHIKNHNLYYACKDKWWERDTCQYERLIGTADDCFEKKAKDGLNRSMCYKIRDDDRRNACRSYVMSTIASTRDYSKCGGNLICLDNVSTGKTDLGYAFCENYRSESDKERCRHDIAVKTKDVKGCDLILDYSTNQICHFDLLSDFDTALSYCSGLEGDPDSLDNIDHQRTLCFFHGCGYLIEKGIYTCEDMLDFVDSQSSVGFLSGYAKFYSDYFKDGGATTNFSRCAV